MAKQSHEQHISSEKKSTATTEQSPDSVSIQPQASAVSKLFRSDGFAWHAENEHRDSLDARASGALNLNEHYTNSILKKVIDEDVKEEHDHLTPVEWVKTMLKLNGRQYFIDLDAEDSKGTADTGAVLYSYRDLVRQNILKSEHQAG